MMELRKLQRHATATRNRQGRSVREPNLMSPVVLCATHKEVVMARKYSKAASKKVEKVMHERKKGTLKSGSGRKVKSRKQAIAIGLSEARKAGAKVPKKAKRKKR